MISTPMLAAAVTAPLRFPLLATPKLDGIRCLVIDGQALTRSLRPLPNDFARAWIESHCPDGFDGELILPGEGFHATSRALMTPGGRPDFEFHVFDYVFDDPDEPYAERISELAALESTTPRCRVRKLLPVEIRDQAALDAFEAHCLDEGFEGVVLRDPSAPYVEGRTTERSAAFLKLKRLADDEAEVVAWDGRALRVAWDGTEFAIGTGFDARTRAEFSARAPVGQLARFSYHPRAGQRRPSSAVFTGLRSRLDL
jgi:DNA ligase-1